MLDAAGFLPSDRTDAVNPLLMSLSGFMLDKSPGMVYHLCCVKNVCA